MVGMRDRYIDGWGAELGLEEQWQQARAEAG